MGKNISFPIKNPTNCLQSGCNDLFLHTEKNKKIAKKLCGIFSKLPLTVIFNGLFSVTSTPRLSLPTSGHPAGLTTSLLQCGKVVEKIKTTIQAWPLGEKCYLSCFTTTMHILIVMKFSFKIICSGTEGSLKISFHFFGLITREIKISSFWKYSFLFFQGTKNCSSQGGSKSQTQNRRPFDRPWGQEWA